MNGLAASTLPSDYVGMHGPGGWAHVHARQAPAGVSLLLALGMVLQEAGIRPCGLWQAPERKRHERPCSPDTALATATSMLFVTGNRVAILVLSATRRHSSCLLQAE